MPGLDDLAPCRRGLDLPILLISAVRLPTADGLPCPRKPFGVDELLAHVAAAA